MLGPAKRCAAMRSACPRGGTAAVRKFAVVQKQHPPPREDGS